MIILKKIVILIFFCFISVPVYSQIEIKFKIGEEIITNIDILEEQKYLKFLRPNLGKLSEEEIKEISEASLIKEIIKRKEIDKIFNKSPGEDFVQNIKNNLFNYKKVSNEVEFKELLKKDDINYEKIIEKVKYEALWNDLIFRKFNSLVKINRKILKKNLEENLKSNKKYEYNLSELLFEIGQNESLELKYREINKFINLTDFKTAAIKYSISGSSSRGGEIGWIKETLLSNKLINLLKQVKINEVTKPIKYPNGFLILKVNEKKEMKQIIDINKELEELVKFERNKQLNQFSLLYYKKLKQNTTINEY